MIDEHEIMPFNFFDYGGVYSGEHHGMRYRIQRTGEKPDYRLMASVWQGPFAYAATAQESRTEETFTCDEQGRINCIEWLKQQYDSRMAEWEAAPPILDAPVDLDALYSKE